MRNAPAGSNIYTVLAVIAAVVLVIGIGFTLYRASELSGGGNPFAVPASDTAR